MVFGYIIKFPPLPRGASSKGEPTVEVMTNKTWEQACEIYEVDEQAREASFADTVGDATHSNGTTLGPNAAGKAYLIRLLHKRGMPDGSLPWMCSNNVVLHHGKQNVHPLSSPIHRPRLITIIGHDGNDADSNDMMAYVSYDGDDAAQITALTESLPDGHITPPAKLAL